MTKINYFRGKINQDKIAKKRMSEIEANPSIGKSEKELDEYLRKRGVKID